MIEVSRTVETTPDRIYAVLADGWSYAGWVVGVSHIRAVDAGWPQVGARIHHSTGLWPLHVQDETTVLAAEAGRSLELEASLSPVGTAKVVFTLTPLADGGTEVTMGEEVTDGPARLVPEQLQAVFLTPRNTETLRRLSDLAIHREPTP